MARHSLHILTFDRGRYDLTSLVKPYHWAFFLVDNEPGTPSTIFQLRGMPGGFYYPGPERIKPSEMGVIKEQLEIGEADDGAIEQIGSILRELWVDKSEHSGWNCQSWCLSGLKRLREQAIVHESMTEEVVSTWLKER